MSLFPTDGVSPENVYIVFKNKASALIHILLTLITQDFTLNI